MKIYSDQFKLENQSSELNTGISFIILSAENHRKECHRFWLSLRHTVILISNDRTSASKKINRMALIRTLTVNTIPFERKNEGVYGFWQTVFSDTWVSILAHDEIVISQYLWYENIRNKLLNPLRNIIIFDILLFLEVSGPKNLCMKTSRTPTFVTIMKDLYRTGFLNWISLDFLGYRMGTWTDFVCILKVYDQTFIQIWKSRTERWTQKLNGRKYVIQNWKL